MFTSFDEKNFKEAIKNKDLLTLKINTVSAILNDPTFERGETDKVIRILEEQIPEIFENEVTSYGVVVSDDELSLTASKSKFTEAKHRLLQTILFVNNMFMLSSTNTTNVFLDDLKIFFKTNNIRATQSVSFLENSGFSHKFDFLISDFKDIPTWLIKTLSVSRNDSLFAKSILIDITQIRLIRDDLTKYYVFINDCSKENTRVNVNPDIITLFNQNDIIPVKYSERNKFIKELAMWTQHCY